MALGPDGGLFVVNYAESHGFPTTAGALQPTKSMQDDAFVLKIGGQNTNPDKTPTPSPLPDPATQPYRVHLPVIVS